MIPAGKLIQWFFYMYNNGWGYIWGTSGQTWTAAKQARATRDMTVRYGKKWIGKVVTDCSGAFVYAFKKEGGSIYHGSNTIWKKYCGMKGKLVKGRREDGEPMKPGTAVFLLKDGNRHHIGCYVGNDTVIEAKGTQYGVTVSRLNHWDEWGELKDVDYTGEIGELPEIDTRRMLRRGCSGTDVEQLQRALNIWNERNGGEAILSVDGAFGPKTEAAVRLFQNEQGVKVDGIIGPQTYGKLDPYWEAANGIN